MRLHRFYVVQPLGEEVVIDDVSLISQWTKVFRYQEGDFVVLFNGDGNDNSYSLDTVTKNSCLLTRTKQSPSYLPQQKITLCLSLIKKDNFELAAQKVTELGITTIIPILSSRSEKKNLSFSRLIKIMQEASEQCLRGDVPHITDIQDLSSALTSITSRQKAIFLDMHQEKLSALKNTFQDKDLFVFIGPEGGWDESDIEKMIAADVHGYSLGDTVLRAETAAIAACSILTA
jgi:16S rRNA (uracil1498-N3)-methyltransferase